MIESMLAALPIATSALLSRRELQHRTDSKFLLDRSMLDTLITELGDHYAALRAGEHAIATYNNLYFDTPDLRCFHDHRRGRRLRRKVRIRHYPDRQLSFLEVKTKRGDVTDKRRRAIEYRRETLDDVDLQFLAEHAAGLELTPSLRIDYRRITLVHLREEERLTIDLGLVAARSDAQVAFESAVVVELKRPPHSRVATPAFDALSKLRERALSKYCWAMCRLQPQLRHNRLLPTLRGLP